MSWIDGLTEEQKRKAGLLPEQQRERFASQLARLSTCRTTAKGEELKGALSAALKRLGR